MYKAHKTYLRNKIGLFYANLKLRDKFLFVYIFFIFIPSSLVSIFFYDIYNDVLKNQVVISIQQSLEQIEINLNDRLKAIVHISDIIFSNENLQKMLSRPKDTADWNQQYEDYLAINKLIENFAAIKDINKIRFYVHDYFMYSKQNINFMNINVLKSTKSYSEIKEKNGQIYWESTRKYKYLDDKVCNVFSASRLIKNFYDIYNNDIGVFSIDVTENVLGDILDRFGQTNNSDIYLVDNDGGILSCRNKELLASNFYKYLEVNPKHLDNSIVEMKIKNQQVLVMKRFISLNNWIIYTVVPVKDIIHMNYSILKMGSIFIILQMIITFTIIALFFNSINKRIHIINYHMDQVSNYETLPPIKVCANDEIGKLKMNFNDMIKTIKHMIMNIENINQKRRFADMKALQSQINPHFLYNTLDSISWMAIGQNAMDISKWITKLAKFLRITLSKGQNTILIKEELEHVTFYLDMQKNIACSTLNWEFNINENIMDVPILKFMFQPLVENSIVHGFLEKEEKGGTIIINGYKANSNIYIQIIDNGIGMSEEKLLKVRQNLMERNFSTSYGLANVNERLKLYYGEECGLFIQSKEGIGTTVSFRYPSP